MEMKYDVFISYSRKDYVDEHGNPREDSAVFKLMAFLDKHNITYWFDKDGIYSGSEFVEVITDAITESKMMIFVSSEHSNDSQWTTGEIFEALEQKKLIVPFKIDNSQYNKKFRMMVRPLDFIEYYSSPEVAFESLLKTIDICKKEYEERIAEEARREAEENVRRHRAEIIKEIKIEALDFQHHVSTIASDAQKILEKQKQIGNIEKKCPVCSTQQPIENAFCKKCGWTFNPVFDENPKGDKDHLFVMRSIWNAVRKSDAVKKELENKIQEQESVIEEKDVKIELLRENCVKLSSELKNYKDKELREQQAREETERKEAERQRHIAAENERKTGEEDARFKDRIFTVNSVTFEMIAVKGGTFTMGASSGDSYAESDEKPTHSVTLGDYYIGKFEVTQELWEAVMGSNPSSFNGSNLPVEQVSWNDCQTFIRKLNSLTGANFRLPTEAEWEYAARGGNKSRGYKYSGSNNVNDVAWYTSTTNDSGTKPVGTKSPNELGIYDMSGNVWEWCHDWYGDYSSGSQTNPTGPSSGSSRVLRGGSWCDGARYCRVSSRFHDAPGDGDNSNGFRLVLVP